MYCEEEELRKQAEYESSVTVPVSVSFSLVYHVDLAESWKALKKAFAALTPSAHRERTSLLSKVLLHEISAGLRHLNSTPAVRKMQELEAFLNSTPELRLEDSVGAVIRSIRANALYTQEAELSDQFCGTFWADILSTLRPEQYYGDEPEGLSDLLFELSCVYAYFGGKEGEEMETSQQRRYALRDAFDLHWQTKLLLHPDVERAKGLLARGEFPANEDICRDILVTEYPEEAAYYPLEELEDRRWDWILDDVFERDSAKAIQMWRTLLDVAAPCLVANPVVAEKLLHDWDVLESASFYTAEAFFSALADETFADQVFASAYVGHLQRQLLELCCKFDRLELGQHCLELALKNPYTSESWERRLKQVLSPAPKHTKAQRSKPSAVSTPDDGTVFHYCTVHVSGTRRPYAYLTGDLSLKVGDWVEVPFGKDDLPRCGQVSSLTVCTRVTAPWPPEQTKTVLRVVDAPVEAEKTPEQAIPPASVSKPIPKPMPEPVRKKTSPKAAPEPATTPEAPPVPAPATSGEDAEMARLLEEIEAEKEREKVAPEKSESIPVTAPKRRFSWQNASGFLAIFVCVVGIGLLVFYLWNQLNQRYEQAVALAEAGSYMEAKARFDTLGGYRDAESLSVYCRYAELYASGTTYDGGLNELSQLTLKRNSALQSDLDDLLARVTALEKQKRLEEERAAAAKKQAEELEAYAGKLPVEGMPYRCLSLTSLGLPDKTEKCQFYDNLDVHRRYKIHHWYNSEGQTVAYCHSHWPKDEDEEVIYAFTYYDPPIGRPNSAPPLVPPFGTSDGSDPYDIEDYITAEDFYWGNRAYFDSLDDAEAYFDNHKS